MARGKKAPNGSGSIWRRPDGRYGAAIPYLYHDPKTGRTKRKRAQTTKKTWDLAHKWFVSTQMDLFGEVVSGGEDPFLGEYLSDWLQDVVEPAVARNTYLKRERAIRIHLAPTLGHVKLSELEPRRLQTLYSRQVRDGLAYATRREVHVTLKMALGQALKWGLVTRNVAGMVDLPKGPPPDEEEEEIRAITDEQAQDLFRTTKESFSRWRYFYMIAIRTGLRPGELLGLKWSDIDLEGEIGSLKVRRTLDTHSYPPVFNPPKSAAAKRTISLHWEASDALASQRAMLESEGLPTTQKSLVFPSTSGTPMNSDNLRKRHLQRDLHTAGLPKLTLHELRHTYASIALFEWRFPPAVVQETLGHESITMTMALYGHLFPGAQEDALRTLAAQSRKGSRKGENSAFNDDVAVKWLSKENRMAEKSA